MTRIILAGPFLWLWGAWHVAWAGGLLWFGALLWLGYDVAGIAAVYFAGLYSVFVPPEVAGSMVNVRRKDGVARTLSEFRQYLPVMAGKGRDGIGWRALGYSGVVDALIVGLIVYPLNHTLGAVLCCIIALWLVAHFGWRHLVGAIALTFVGGLA